MAQPSSVPPLRRWISDEQSEPQPASHALEGVPCRVVRLLDGKTKKLLAEILTVRSLPPTTYHLLLTTYCLLLLLLATYCLLLYYPCHTPPSLFR